MDKAQLLQAVTELASRREITSEELNDAYSIGLSGKEDHALRHRLSVSESLYYIGASIVMIGIAIFIGQHWDSLNSITRIVATLGSGIAAFVVGAIFSKQNLLQGVGQGFFFLSAILLPLGLAVSFYEAGLELESFGVQSLISGILLATYISSFFAFRKVIFLGFAIMFGTYFFFAITNYLLDTTPLFDSWKFHNYRVLLVGVSYIFLGYYFKNSRLETFANPLYTFGLLGVLGAALFLGGWAPHSHYSLLWQLLFPFLVFGFIYLSVILKERSFLMVSSLYLMIFILKITAEHFSDNLGWPLALILSGLALIGIGFGAFYVNQTYLQKETANGSDQ